MSASDKKNLILGAAVGYQWPQMEVFVNSLRGVGCTAQVVLLVGRIDAHTRMQLRNNEITVVSVHRLVSRLPQKLARKRFNRYWLGWLHRSIPRVAGVAAKASAGRVALLARVASWFHHPACSRYFHYYRFLRRHLSRYDLVLTSDVRDVVFQSDPFGSEWRPQPSSVFLEHDAVHGAEIGNDRWIDIGFGAAGLAELRGKRVTCSGLTLAKAPDMLHYLREMTCELASRTDRFTGLDGVDQGVHNWLYWTGRLPQFQARENLQGPVFTMHGLPSELLKQNGGGQLVDGDGRIIPALHQYDRHESLGMQIQRLWTHAQQP